MKHILKLMLSGVLFFQFTLTPLSAQAISFNFLSKAGQEIPKVIGWSVEKATASNPAGLMAHLADSEGKKFFALFASTPKPELKKFVSQFGQSAMNFSKAGAKLSAETLKRFPVEAFTFFLAIGALNIQQLVFNYGENPVILQQHIESQKDPYSQLGFAAFMLANSWATAPLQAMLEPGSKLRPFIPYMGMTVGMMASNIVAELAHFSETKKCVADLNTRIAEAKKYESCQKAFDSMTDFTIEKLHEWAPGLMSMVASQVAAVYLEKFVISKVLVFLGVEALMLAAPGGAASKAFRFSFKWIGKIGQIGLFMGLDQMMHGWFSVPYNDIKDSLRLNNQEEHLLGLLYEKKKNGWNPSTEKNSGEDLDLSIRRMSDMIKSWREANLADISMSVATWTQFMSQYTTMYRSSKIFYTHVVNQLNEKTYRNRPGFTQYIDRVMPLYGISPLDLKAEDQASDLFTGPVEYFRHQRMKVAEVTQQLKQLLATTDLKDHSESDLKFLNTLVLLMESNDDQKIGQAMDLINKELRMRIMYPGLFAAPPTPPLDYISANYGPDAKLNTLKGLQRTLVQLRNTLGAPVPLWNAGAGFLSAYQADPEKAPVLEQLTSTPSSINGITTIKPVQYFVGSMVAGPDVNKREALITFTSGFPAKFFPPKISTIDDFKINTNELKDWKLGVVPTILNIPVYLRRGQQTTRMENLFEVVRQGHIRPEVLGNAEKAGISDWWSANVETEYIKSWEAFEQKYQKNAVALIKRFFDAKERFTNSSPLSNSVSVTLQQERKLYLMILGEMFSDLNNIQNGTQMSLPLSPKINADARARGSLQKELRPFTTTQLLTESLDGATKIPLLRSLVQTDSLSLKSAISPYLGLQTTRINSLVANAKTAQSNYQFQDEIMSQFDSLENLIRQFKVVQSQPTTMNLPSEFGNASIELQGEIIASDVTNADLEASYKKIEDTLRNLEKNLGLETGKAPENSDEVVPLIGATINLSAFQKRIASQLINGLRNNAAELKNIGSMMNTVSYRRAEANNETGFDTSCVNRTTGVRSDLKGSKLVLERCKKTVSN